jgi:hypothetical protein
VRDGVELKLAGGVGGNALAPVGRLGFEHDHGALDGAMLRVVYDAADSPVDVGEGGEAGEEQRAGQDEFVAHHVV